MGRPPGLVNCDGKHYRGPGGRGTRPDLSTKKEASYEKAPGLASVCRNFPRSARDSVGEVIRLLKGQEAEEDQLVIAKVVGRDLVFAKVEGEGLVFEEIIEEGFGCHHRVAAAVSLSLSVTARPGIRSLRLRTTMKPAG